MVDDIDDSMDDSHPFASAASSSNQSLTSGRSNEVKSSGRADKTVVKIGNLVEYDRAPAGQNKIQAVQEEHFSALMPIVKENS